MMKETVIIFIFLLISFFSQKGYAQQESYWFKINEQVEISSKTKYSLDNTVYIKIVITGKGIMLFTVENQKEYNEALAGDSMHGTFFPFITSYSKQKQVVAEKGNKRIILSVNAMKINYFSNTSNNGFVYVGYKVDLPKISSLSTNNNISIFPTEHINVNVNPVNFDFQTTQNDYSSPKSTCTYCNGTGKRCKYGDVATYGVSGEGHRCKYCGEWLNHGTYHALVKCTWCNGTGVR